jgi:hypothetical protein
MDKSEECVPFTLFGDPLLNLRQGSAIKSIVSEMSKLCIAGLTHVVNRLIASLMD